MWKTIYRHLKNSGFDVYSPGQHTGMCEASYIVISEGGSSAFAGQNKVGYSKIRVYIYHPLGKYSTLSDYAEQVKASMAELDNLRNTGYMGPVIVLDEERAYQTDLEYLVLKKL